MGRLVPTGRSRGARDRTTRDAAVAGAADARPDAPRHLFRRCGGNAAWLLAAALAAGCGPGGGSPATQGSVTGETASAETAMADAAPGAASAGAGMPDRFGFGRPATHEEIAAWDIDVMPDGTGLPAGEGTAESGASVYARQCASCHGRAGEGATAAALVGYEPESAPPFGPRYEEWRGGGEDVPFTVGNYWPYATTLYDYIYRAMPSGAPGTLAPDEVYGLVAWLLAENRIIARDAVMNAATLPAVEMPARDIFVPQER